MNPRLHPRLFLLAGAALFLALFGQTAWTDAGAAASDPGRAAVAELAKAAEQGDAPAQCELGHRLLMGIDINSNPKKGVDWLQQSATQGNVQAQLFLASAYAGGVVIPPNEQAAVKWYRQAADQHNVEAAYRLGQIYKLGLRTIPPDQLAAARWFRQAADQGFAPAQLSLGLLYANGQGVPQADKEANRWFRRAAQQGSAEAQYHLGTHYDTGKGVHHNYVEAYKWLNLAAAQSYTRAIDARDKVAQKLTREQLADAQRLCLAFVPLSASEFVLPTQAKPDLTAPIEEYGSGFFVTEDGYVLTNYHFLTDADYVLVRTESGIYPVTLVKTDPLNDLALLKTTGRGKALPVVSDRNVKVGDPVFSIGYVSTQLEVWEPKAADGNVKYLSGLPDDPRYLQINLPLKPGHSGAPLLDAMGNVIGVVTIRPADLRPQRNTDSSARLFKQVLKSSYALGLLESVSELAGKLKPPATAQDRKFDDLVKETQAATVQVLVY